MPEEDKTPVNRFYRHSRVWPGQFQQDWNRSFVLLPLGKPRGGVVLLHGLTDSPYSVRYLAQLWQQRGYVAVVPRLPGHGTAPGALTAVDWETAGGDASGGTRSDPPCRGGRAAASGRLL